MRRLLLTILLITGFCIQNISAQTQVLVLQHADGVTTEVELYTKPKITFEGDKLFVNSSVIDLEYQIGDVVRFFYKGAKSGNNGSETGNNGSETGNNGSETGNNGSETGDNGSETGIDGLRKGIDYEQFEEQLVFHNIKSEDQVAVYNLNGIRVPIRITYSNGNASLLLSSIPTGVYLLSVNGKTVKFKKP